MPNSNCITRSQLFLQYLLALDMIGEDRAFEHVPEAAALTGAAADPDYVACVALP